jgi:hypothetical protein
MAKPIYLCEKLPIPPGTAYQPKRVYLSRAAAKAAARQSTGKLRPYLCPCCNLWHLTTLKGNS